MIARARKALAAALAIPAMAAAAPLSADPDPADWPAVLEAARGQTVYWHAWGGDERINAYIDWAGERVADLHGLSVRHVKLADTADAVARVLADKAAGRDEDGAVDLIWINGENFAAMKANGLLFGPWAEDLPNWALVDVAGKPAVTADFTIPTEGLEAPWSMAQVVFYHDSARLPEPPRDMAALLDWAQAHPGRFAFPQPPDFLGSTFLKQALYGLTDDPAALLRPAEAADYAAVTAPLWAWLDDLTPNLWRGGRAYPQNGPRLRQLMADGEIDLALAFGAGEASAAIASFQLPDTVRSYAPAGGGVGNASFVAIPYNASAKAGAMVLADFLLSPQAQARKQDPAYWGAQTVLDVAALPPEDRALFDAIDLGPATPTPEELGPTRPEPHPSWMVRLEEDWARRYGAGRRP
jgi:putative thiamine transport system substrate-binding protein